MVLQLLETEGALEIMDLCKPGGSSLQRVRVYEIIDDAMHRHGLHGSNDDALAGPKAALNAIKLAWGEGRRVRRRAAAVRSDAYTSDGMDAMTGEDENDDQYDPVRSA